MMALEDGAEQGQEMDGDWLQIQQAEALEAARDPISGELVVDKGSFECRGQVFEGNGGGEEDAGERWWWRLWRWTWRRGRAE